MGTGFAKKKKQMKMFQEQFSKLQEQMKALEVTGVAGGGLVSMTLNGEHELLRLQIKPECVDPTDIEGLEDLIKAAYTDACTQLKEQTGQSGGEGGLPDLSAFGL